MASLSPVFLLNSFQDKDTQRKNSEKALYVALGSIVSGSIHPLFMLDTEDACKRPVLYSESGSS